MAGRWKANGTLLVGVIALAGCMPIGTDDAYYGPASAPPPPRAPIGGSSDPSPDDAYAYLDRAEALWAAIGQSPPDHSFDFDGAQPWAWETADGHWVVVEDRDAQMRSYYFAPGARDPFLIAEGGNRFAFAKGRLVYVYDAQGRPVDPDGADSDALTRRAGWLLDRGRSLRAVLSRREWESIDSASWIDTSPMLWSNIDIWFATRDIDPGWRRYRDTREAWLLREQLAAERRRREELARRFREWREHGFQGPPPPGVRPPHGWPWGGPRPGKPPIPGQPGPGGPPPPPPPGTSGPQPPNGPGPVPPRGPWRPGWPAPGTEGAGGPPRVPPPPPTRPPATAGPQQPDGANPPVPPRWPWRPGWPAPGAGAPPHSPPHVPPPHVPPPPGTPPSASPPRPAPPAAGAPIHDDGRPLPDRPRPGWDGDRPRPDWTAGRPRPEPQSRPTPPFMPPPRSAPNLDPRPHPAPPVAAPAPPRPAPAPHPAPRPAPPPRVEHGHAVLERQIRQQD